MKKERLKKEAEEILSEKLNVKELLKKTTYLET